MKYYVGVSVDVCQNGFVAVEADRYRVGGNGNLVLLKKKDQDRDVEDTYEQILEIVSGQWSSVGSVNVIVESVTSAECCKEKEDCTS